MPVDLILDADARLELGTDLTNFPDHGHLEAALRALESTLPDARLTGLVSVRVCTSHESASLNKTYRGKDKPTNVLSFAADVSGLPEEVIAEIAEPELGDLAICGQVVISEAAEQGKAVRDHFMHLFVHGVLHLLGLDHAEEGEAKAMEGLEVRVLEKLGIGDPYAPCK